MALEKLSDIEKGIYTRVICPICKNETYDMYWICPVCGWEYDGAISDSDYSSANKTTVLSYRESYEKSLTKQQ